ncbi:MAG: HAD family hydrolase [Nitrospirae bacterium]|nr:HAD family hydrolase [Nitrospirota bacterium]
MREAGTRSEPPKVVVLDCDGVILESVDIKTWAFRKLFEADPEFLDQIVSLHIRLGGTSRYKKFELVYRDILRRPLSDSESQALGREFSRLVVAEMLTCPMVEGALAFLEAFSGRCPLFIVSGTPEEELREIVAARGLSRFFRGTYGAPRGKAELLSLVARESRCPSDSVLYVGDSQGDLESAIQAQVRFVARVRPDRLDPFEPVDGSHKVRDLAELSARWPELWAAS